ncbi:MAG: 50S ribosomal protein L10 [Nitrospiria bacterium]
MNKEEKKVVASHLNEKFSRATVAVVADFSGMGVEEIRNVRIGIRDIEGEFKVVKNKVATYAAAGTALEGIGDFFKGPTAVTLGYLDPVAPVKALKELADKNKKLRMKVAVVEGKVVDLEGIRQIAKLPSKTVLIGTLVGRFKSPLYGFAGSLNGVLSKFAGTLQALHEKRLEQ